MKKKLLSLALVCAMILTLGATALAVNETGGSTNVTYSVDPTYTITIPAAVELSDNGVSANIEASSVLLENEKKIVVSLTAASYTASGNTFSAKNGNSVVTYNIKKGEELIAINDPVAEFTTDNNQALNFTILNKEGITVAGDHTETLTFTIAVVDAPVVAPRLADALTDGATLGVGFTLNGVACSVSFTNNNGTFVLNDSSGVTTAEITVNSPFVYVNINGGYEQDDGGQIEFVSMGDVDGYCCYRGSNVTSLELISFIVNGVDIFDDLEIS